MRKRGAMGPWVEAMGCVNGGDDSDHETGLFGGAGWHKPGVEHVNICGTTNRCAAWLHCAKGERGFGLCKRGAHLTCYSFLFCCNSDSFVHPASAPCQVSARL